MKPDIAIIDSGVNPAHFHVRHVSGGHGYVLNSKGDVEKKQDFSDQIGHGTAISGIIRQKAPFANLYSIKIFQQDLTAPAPCLVEALKWAIEKPMKIIHLSLGVEPGIMTHDLECLCNKARAGNILVLASARGPEDKIFPAVFPSVIGVYWHHDCNRDQMVFHSGARVEFGAHGFPRSIPGVPREQNFKGSSFAVAHVTARVAQLVKKCPAKGLSEIKNMLSREAEAIK